MELWIKFRDCMYHPLDHRDGTKRKMVKQLCNLGIIYILDHRDDMKKKMKIVKQCCSIELCNLGIVCIIP